MPSLLTSCFIASVSLILLLTVLEVINYDSVYSTYKSAVSRFIPSKTIFSPSIEVSINSKMNIFGKGISQRDELSSCVPYFDLMRKKAMALVQKDKNSAITQPIVLLAAFEYEGHLSVTIQNDGLLGVQLYCHFFDEDFNPIEGPSPGYVYPMYVVSCCRKEGAAFVSVTEFPYETAVRMVPITRRETKVPEYALSVCLCPIYGNTSSWLMLTELVEHYKLQGVDHFYVYIRDMDEYSRKLLHSYVASGDIEPIFLSDHVTRTGMYWQMIAIQDCLVRSRYHSKYTISQDLDERISPLGQYTLRDYVLGYFANHTKVGIISFRMRWILRTQIPPSLYGGNDTLTKHLPTLIYHNTSAPAPPGHTAKNILDPLKVMAMWVHYASELFPDYTSEYVPPQTFEIRHYRDVVISDWGTRWMPETQSFGNYTATDYPKHIMKRLFDNVKARLDMVYLQ